MSALHRITIELGDITAYDVDMIVNAANSALCGGGGVDGAIHDAAGDDLLRACMALGRCDTGDAKLTPGFKLKARWVAHAVGPVWRGGTHNEAAQLASCYRRSLELARDEDCTTIAFPAISTGAYRYPLRAAAGIATRTVAEFLGAESRPERVILVCFDHVTRKAYYDALQQLRATPP